jgi:hypothetical protein
MPSVKREPLIVEPPLALLTGGVHSISNVCREREHQITNDCRCFIVKVRCLGNR